jgi:hypothetical protein
MRLIDPELLLGEDLLRCTTSCPEGDDTPTPKLHALAVEMWVNTWKYVDFLRW